jgi:hypothetical protein
MRGNYSPTVTAAYMKDQRWWEKYAFDPAVGDEWVMYDPEGYDSYGYDKDDVDRAGNQECAYYTNDAPLDSDDDYNWKYNDALGAWGFDGTKPVLRG